MATALLDAVDLPLTEGRVWRLLHAGHGYAYTRERVEGKPVLVLLHRFLLGIPPGRAYGEVDHVNGNTLDNRRANLRFATHAQNMQNRRLAMSRSSAFRGVSWNKRLRKWTAQGQLNGKRYWLGSFDSEAMAAEAAREWRRVHFPFAEENGVLLQPML